ncbi:MAG: hypothetical protein QW507_00665 [Candidatus Nanoarchaeia archaeon]|nr:hypothetical protein [Candidatus Haiyanarchaeum thermophilum]MCW1302906.1 hypothetical protein [Candidatus Haiyanarchaeum thermophilum]MCW1303585.1 hypothetical protein [Candidatus Haiyanarchaeum thermophilum]MCW1306267.1 hypothetical protein [Candidatus Haiyanarchaeum thermophilum]MCW1307497.1 hypothetical protein [Candidatus Haiyanarchaeum thermophilum]
MELEEEERRDIVQMLNEARTLLQAGKINELKDCSNKVIHSMTIYQDKYATNAAVIVYAISKTLERWKLKQEERELSAFVREMKEELEKLSSLLERGEFEEFLIECGKVRGKIAQVDSHFSDYMEEVLHKARLKKASKVYEHGLSIGKAAELLGLSEWELMQYAGKTKVHDVDESKIKDLRKRLKELEEIFK